MNTKAQWHIVYTKTKCEKKVADLLNRRGFESYCPLNTVQSQRSDRKKFAEAPLFSSFVFVRIAPAQQAEVKRMNGIINFIYWQGSPAVINDHEIATMKEFLQEHRQVHVQKTWVSLDERVQYVKRSFFENELNQETDFQNIVKITLPSLGYALLAEEEASHIKVINVTKQKQDTLEMGYKNFKLA